VITAATIDAAALMTAAITLAVAASITIPLGYHG
jgi:hypothetical protein